MVGKKALLHSQARKSRVLSNETSGRWRGGRKQEGNDTYGNETLSKYDGQWASGQVAKRSKSSTLSTHPRASD